MHQQNLLLAKSFLILEVSKVLIIHVLMTSCDTPPTLGLRLTRLRRIITWLFCCEATMTNFCGGGVLGAGDCGADDVITTLRLATDTDSVDDIPVSAIAGLL